MGVALIVLEDARRFIGLGNRNAISRIICSGKQANNNVRVDAKGFPAASIASAIAYTLRASSRATSTGASPGSMIATHRPTVYVAGTVDDMEKAKDVLMKIEEASPRHHAK